MSRHNEQGDEAVIASQTSNGPVKSSRLSRNLATCRTSVWRYCCCCCRRGVCVSVNSARLESSGGDSIGGPTYLWQHFW